MIYVYIIAERSGAAPGLVLSLLISGGFCCCRGWARSSCGLRVQLLWPCGLFLDWGSNPASDFPKLTWSFHTVDLAAAPSSQ